MSGSARARHALIASGRLLFGAASQIFVVTLIGAFALLLFLPGIDPDRAPRVAFVLAALLAGARILFTRRPTNPGQLFRGVTDQAALLLLLLMVFAALDRGLASPALHLYQPPLCADSPDGPWMLCSEFHAGDPPVHEDKDLATPTPETDVSNHMERLRQQQAEQERLGLELAMTPPRCQSGQVCYCPCGPEPLAPRRPQSPSFPSKRHLVDPDEPARIGPSDTTHGASAPQQGDPE
jgi:hypothetical protein